MPISAITLPRVPPAPGTTELARCARPQLRPDHTDTRLPGLAPGTLIQTLSGPLPVETLLAGDMLIDAAGQVAELRARHVLRPVQADMVRVCPGALDPGARLDRDLVVGAGQTLILDDWRTRLVHGGPAPVPAWRLTDDMLIARERHFDAVLHLLVLDSSRWLLANGHRIGAADPALATAVLRRMSCSAQQTRALRPCPQLA